MNQKYKTLEPRSKSGGDAHSLERLTNGSRRVLPDVPSHSLPRQAKRAQSDSRSRDRAEEVTKRFQSHGDNANGDNGRRKLPQVPNRDLREPTPDYDSPPPSDNRLRRNSDSGLLDVIEERGDEGGGGVKRHASSVDKSQKRMYLNNSLDNSMESDESKGSGHSHRSAVSQSSVKNQGTSGSNGSPINKHPKLEPRLSSSSIKSIKNVNMTPPPVLPPKTRKLQQGTGLQTAGQVVQTLDRQVVTTNGTNTGATSTTGSSGEHNITKRQHQLLLQQKGSNQETFVDDGVSVSVVRIGPGSGSGINRSVSSVGTIGSRARTRVPKPVRNQQISELC